MRCAFVSTILNHVWGGADTLWTRAAEASVERGDAVLISVSAVVARHPRIAALHARGAQISLRAGEEIPVSLAARARKKLRRLTARQDPLVAALAAFRPDLVVFSLAGTYDLMLEPKCIQWLKTTRTKFRVIANWQMEQPYLTAPQLALTREIFSLAERVNFVSTRNQTTTRRHLLLPLLNTRVLQNPLRWSAAEVTPWPESPPWRLATVSRLDQGKGIHVLLHALAHAHGARTDWVLNIYGSGVYESYLRDTADFLGLSDRVHLRGHVGDLRAIWQENHLMCSPAIEDGVPMTIPEAMLCERPVLATCVGGAEDWLRHDETGFLCAAPTVPLLAETLRSALAVPSRWQGMGQAAARAARARYRAKDYLSLLD